MILITGASGKTGQATLKRLGSMGAGGVRAMVRRAEQIAEAKKCGASDVVVGDLRDPGDLAQALDGIEVVYHICPNMQPDEVAIAELLIRAAQNAGVKRIVYHSVLHPQTQEMPHHWHKLRAEELLFKSGVGYTILQPAAYMQNVLTGWTEIVEKGIYRVPYTTKTILGMVDLVDVAEAAAKVLTESGHEGAVYELATAEWLSQDECARIMGKVLGQTVAATEIDRVVWKKGAQQAGLNDFAIDTLIKMFDYYEQYGFCGNPTVLTTLLQRKPTTFEAFVKRTVQ